MAPVEFLEATDGLKLACRIWEVPGPPRGVVCLLHGLGEHGGRYDHLAQFLNRAGWTVHALDLRGHGISEGKRGHAPSYDQILEDISLFLGKAAGRFAGTGLFLYGHSMGGGLALNYALRKSSALAGIVATGPLLETAFPPPAVKLVLARVLSRLWPSLALPSSLDTAAISRDAAVISAYLNDPLVHDRLSVRMGLEILAAGRWAMDKAAGLNLPCLIMHGDADRLCLSRASELFSQRAGGECSLKIWPGLYHELHNEPEKEEVFAWLLNWLEKTLTREVTAL